MGFGVSLVTFSPNSTIKSADVNSNFTNLNNATDFQGNLDTATSGVAMYVSDETVGGGNTINFKPSPASPARFVAVSSRDGSGVFHVGGYVDFSGRWTMPIGLNFNFGSMSTVSTVAGSGSQTVSHSMGVVPSAVFIAYSGNFGTAPTQSPAWFGQTSSQVSVAAQAGYAWVLWCFRT